MWQCDKLYKMFVFRPYSNFFCFLSVTLGVTLTKKHKVSVTDKVNNQNRSGRFTSWISKILWICYWFVGRVQISLARVIPDYLDRQLVNGFESRVVGVMVILTNKFKLIPNMNEESNELKLHTISSAARLLRVGRDTIYHFIDSGKLGYIQVGKRIKIPHSELITFQQRELTFNSSSGGQNTITEQLEKHVFNVDKSIRSFDVAKFISQEIEKLNHKKKR